MKPLGISLVVAALFTCPPVAVAQLQEQIGAFSSPLPQPPQPPPIGKAVLAGTVVNAKTGEPVRKASVNLNGPNIQLSAVTDSSGSFTFRALPEGSYFLNASHEGFYIVNGNANQNIMLKDDEEKRGISLKLIPGALITGRVVDDDDVPLVNCNIQAIRFDSHSPRRQRQFQGGSATDDQGRYRITSMMAGRYTLRASCPETFPAPHGFMRLDDPLIPVEGFAPTDYAAGDTSSSSSGVPVAPGAEMSGFDFHLKRIPLYIVRGILSGPDPGLLQSTQISLASHDSGDAVDDLPIGAQIEAGGRFTLQHVPAGSYQLTALALNGETAFEGRQSIQTGQSSVTEANVKLIAAGALSGRIDSDDPNANFENWQVSLIPLSNNYRGPYAAAKVERDGTFEFKAILPGHFRLNVPPVGYVKSFSAGGRDISPLDFEIAGAGAGPLHIQLGTKMATIKVALSPAPAKGQTMAGILFNADAPDVVPGRDLSMSDPQGNLNFAPAPGKYKLLVVESANPWMIANDAGVLKSLENRTVAVEVAEGEEKQISAASVSVEELQKALDAVE